MCRPWLLAGLQAGSEPHGLDRMLQLPRRKDLLLGYPINMARPPEAFFAWRRELARAGLGEFAWNNVGNPWEHSHIPFNTHEFERELIERFARIYRFPADDTWGFLTNSGTDSNMHGLYIGRTLLKGRTGITPKIYFTEEAHYSVQILRDLLALEWIHVGTRPDGAMDPEDLADKLSQNRDTPALVVPTVGTTFRGSVDPLDAIIEKLKAHPLPHYVHVDAALFGGYLPHTPHSAEIAPSRPAPETGGALRSRYDSLAVSCHKFFGFASPAGLFLVRRSDFETFKRLFSEVHDPEYILQVPGTITCSRDAVKPAEFHFFSTPEALARQAEDTRRILANTTYLLGQMRSRFPHLHPVRENEMSNTIYFRRPSDEIVERYSLATMTLRRDGRPEPHAHVVVMPHASRAILNRFLNDLDRTAAHAA